jgi:hypothetical protein
MFRLERFQQVFRLEHRVRVAALVSRSPRLPQAILRQDFHRCSGWNVSAGALETKGGLDSASGSWPSRFQIADFRLRSRGDFGPQAEANSSEVSKPNQVLVFQLEH